jgi:transcriptional regulator with XRE-family HTH domain
MLNFTFASFQEICEELGQRLRVHRMGLNLTQQEVALLAGVSKGTISNIEKHGQGTLESLVRVIQAMGLTKELQPLFQSQPTSIEQLKHAAQIQSRQRVSRKRKP